MPPETFTGSDPSSLFAKARAALGPDAVILGVRRTGAPGASRFELTACAPLLKVWVSPCQNTLPLCGKCRAASAPSM